MNLKSEVRSLMKKGIYHPDELFRIIYARNPVHYAKVREAIHEVKVS